MLLGLYFCIDGVVRIPKLSQFLNLFGQIFPTFSVKNRFLGLKNCDSILGILTTPPIQKLRPRSNQGPHYEDSKFNQYFSLFLPYWGVEGVIYRCQLSQMIEQDPTFYLRQNRARYDEELQFYGVFSKIHDFSIGRKSQLKPLLKIVFLHRFFMESDIVLVTQKGPLSFLISP